MLKAVKHSTSMQFAKLRHEHWYRLDPETRGRENGSRKKKEKLCTLDLYLHGVFYYSVRNAVCSALPEFFTPNVNEFCRSGHVLIFQCSRVSARADESHAFHEETRKKVFFPPLFACIIDNDSCFRVKRILRLVIGPSLASHTSSHRCRLFVELFTV